MMVNYFYNSLTYMYLNTNLCESYFVMQFFMDEQAISSAAIEYVRHAWSTYFLNFYNSKIINQ